jgi:hypothetical protein
LKAIMAWLATADQRVTAESGLTHYIDEIRRVPMLEPQDEYMLAKRWREYDDLEAVHKLVNSHLRLVARIAKGYRGYGLPISEFRNISSAFSRLFTPRSPAEWGWGCRSAGPSSMPMGAGYGEMRTSLAAPYLSLPCPARKWQELINSHQEVRQT